MIRIARVVAVHPQRRSVDLVFLDDGTPAAEVPVLSGTVGSDSGVWDLPSVQRPTSPAAVAALSGGRNLLAAVGHTPDGRPLVLGFVHPARGQMNFSQDDRTVSRHSSGAYFTVAPDGSAELWHPAGAYVRIGTGPHEDLGQHSADGNWSTPPGAPPARITVATEGFTLVIEPGGKTTLTSSGDANLSWAGKVTVQSGDDMLFQSGGALAFTAARGTTMTSSGDLTITAPQIDLNP